MDIRSFIRLLICGVTGIGIYNLGLNYAEIYVSPAICGFMVSMMPVVALIIARFFYQERLSLRMVGFITISVAGVLLILISNLMHQANIKATTSGFVALIIAVISISIFVNVQRPLFQKGFHPLEVSAWTLWCGTLSMLFYLPDLVQQMAQATLADHLVVIYLGIFPAAVAYACYSYAIAQLPFPVVITSMYVPPFLVIIQQWLILGYWPYALTLIGGMLSVLGAFLTAKYRPK